MHEVTKDKIVVMENIHDENDRIAENVNKNLSNKGIFAINVMGAPGTGKTSVLKQLIRALKNVKPYVIEGDIESDIDTLDLRSLGIETYQINTFGACHLDAPLIAHAIFHMGLGDREGAATDGECEILGGKNPATSDKNSAANGEDHTGCEYSSVLGRNPATAKVLFIENIGNLVCPAEFSIGEHIKLLICSVTDGSDKPYKYPLAFEKADMVILNKIDLAPHLSFDEDFFLTGIKRLNASTPVFQTSCKTGEGFEPVAAYINHLAAEQYQNRRGI